MSRVDRLIGAPSGPGLQPWGIVQEEARIVLDAFMLEAQGDPQPLRKCTGEIDRLLRIAVAHYAERFPRAGASWRGWGRYGIVQARIDHGYSPLGARSNGLGYRFARVSELDYSCMFCRTSLATLDGETSGKLPRPFVAKLARHANECAIRMLAGELQPKGPSRKKRKP